MKSRKSDFSVDTMIWNLSKKSYINTEGNFRLDIMRRQANCRYYVRGWHIFEFSCRPAGHWSFL